MGALTLLKLSVLVVILGVAWRLFFTRRPQETPVEGFFLPEYRPVAELFRKYVADGTERGGSFSVYRQGEPLVDLWGGYADAESKQPWQEDTVTIAWSVTKGISALCIAKLVERGLMDYKAEVRQYWPEFDQNGKGNITLGMLLSHQAGLFHFGGESVTLMEYKNDWQKVEKVLAAVKPVHPPGAKLVYHAISFGMYVDALIRRVDPQHRNLSQFFHDEVAEPFGIDFQVGLPRQEYFRNARMYLPTAMDWLALYLDPPHWALLWTLHTDTDTNFLTASSVIKDMTEIESVRNPYLAEVGVGSMMGFSSARPLAKLYSILANDGAFHDKQLLTKALVDEFSIPQGSGFLDFSRGFIVGQNRQGDTVFGHPGYGGQQAQADPKNKLGISYVTNFMSALMVRPTDNFLELERLFYDCFEKHTAKTSK